MVTPLNLTETVFQGFAIKFDTAVIFLDLSLRDNPLVVRFVQEMTYDPTSLQEMTARTIKLFRIPFANHELPKSLHGYLSSASRCVNQNAKIGHKFICTINY
ncbi:hypothetical protein CEXT_172311 [Caerostris extrusa]|uniref:Uncharacterized protein n=1 Tax=Caerostris extrusa TaxID=172846 RepID=A0AAV4WMD6_CAEEX|nr:hypothetical protein CEXT_172311 [Caerostris extrusa]